MGTGFKSVPISMERYSYHFNEREMFYRMLWRLREVRTALAQEREYARGYPTR